MHADKHENFVQIVTMIFDVDGQAFPKFPKQQVCNVFQYLKIEVRDKVDFLLADKHESFLQVDFNTWGIKIFYKVILLLLMGMVKHSQNTQSNNLEKVVRDGVHFQHADKHQRFYKLSISFLMEVARHVHSTKNTKLLIFLQYLNDTLKTFIHFKNKQQKSMR